MLYRWAQPTCYHRFTMVSTKMWRTPQTASIRIKWVKKEGSGCNALATAARACAARIKPMKTLMPASSVKSTAQVKVSRKKTWSTTLTQESHTSLSTNSAKKNKSTDFSSCGRNLHPSCAVHSICYKPSHLCSKVCMWRAQLNHQRSRWQRYKNKHHHSTSSCTTGPLRRSGQRLSRSFWFIPLYTYRSSSLSFHQVRRCPSGIQSIPSWISCSSRSWS